MAVSTQSKWGHSGGGLGLKRSHGLSSACQVGSVEAGWAGNHRQHMPTNCQAVPTNILPVDMIEISPFRALSSELGSAGEVWGCKLGPNSDHRLVVWRWLSWRGEA